MHFLSRDNTYAYVRYTEKEAVLVYLNASDEERFIPVKHYAEILDKYATSGKDVISGRTIMLNKPVSVKPLTAIVLPLRHK